MPTSSGSKKGSSKASLAQARVVRDHKPEEPKKKARPKAVSDQEAADSGSVLEQARRAEERREAELALKQDKAYEKKPLPKKKPEKRTRKQVVTAVAVGAFAVVMALAMMLPSFSAIFASGNSDDSSEASSSDSSSDSSSSDSSDSTSSDATGIAAIDANYQPIVDELEAKLADSPQDLATLLNLGNDYMNWGYQASSYAANNNQMTEENAEHVVGIFQKAMNYYDQYLALNDSNAVRVNRALCQLYSGDIDGAQAALTQITQDHPDYGPAWANLGLCYEVQGATSSAKDAYNKAKEADPNDDYGASTFATQRLALIQQQEQSDATSATSGTADGSATTTTQGLSDTLASKSGTGL